MGRPRATDEELLDEIRACAQELGRVPTRDDFNERHGGKNRGQLIALRFGSWRAGRARALGLDDVPELVPRRRKREESAPDTPAAIRAAREPIERRMAELQVFVDEYEHLARALRGLDGG